MGSFRHCIQSTPQCPYGLLPPLYTKYSTRYIHTAIPILSSTEDVSTNIAMVFSKCDFRVSAINNGRATLKIGWCIGTLSIIWCWSMINVNCFTYYDRQRQPKTSFCSRVRLILNETDTSAYVHEWDRKYSISVLIHFGLSSRVAEKVVPDKKHCCTLL